MNEQCQILVADDNVVNQIFAKRLLERSGYRVDTVSNGAEAIAALERKRYHLVVMDCMMPVLDGYSATEVIRASSPDRFDPQIPIIATTALATSRDREKCFSAGMTDYVSKPIVASTFLHKVANNLGKLVDSGNSPQSSGGGQAGPGENEAQLKIQAELLSSMSASIVTEAEQWLRQLRVLAKAGDVDGLRLLAHKIRGTADIVGRRELSAISERLEDSAGAGELESTSKLNTRLIEELQQLIFELQESA